MKSPDVRKGSFPIDLKNSSLLYVASPIITSLFDIVRFIKGLYINVLHCDKYDYDLVSKRTLYPFPRGYELAS